MSVRLRWPAANQSTALTAIDVDSHAAGRAQVETLGQVSGKELTDYWEVRAGNAGRVRSIHLDRPACRMTDSMSHTLHSSEIFPALKRNKVMPSILIFLPVAGKPIPACVLVPEAVQ